MTIGEIFSKAAGQHFAGYGYRVTVLILISGIIYLFKTFLQRRAAAAAKSCLRPLKPPSE